MKQAILEIKNLTKMYKKVVGVKDLSLSLKEGEILTYEKLEELGIDSVVIYKESISRYTIDFAEIGSYDKFKDEFYI